MAYSSDACTPESMLQSQPKLWLYRTVYLSPWVRSRPGAYPYRNTLAMPPYVWRISGMSVTFSSAPKPQRGKMAEGAVESIV